MNQKEKDNKKIMTKKREKRKYFENKNKTQSSSSLVSPLFFSSILPPSFPFLFRTKHKNKRRFDASLPM
jgi:hypothetical protein